METTSANDGRGSQCSAIIGYWPSPAQSFVVSGSVGNRDHTSVLSTTYIRLVQGPTRRQEGFIFSVTSLSIAVIWNILAFRLRSINLIPLEGVT
jgi:hypothetical protein